MVLFLYIYIYTLSHLRQPFVPAITFSTVTLQHCNKHVQEQMEKLYRNLRCRLDPQILQISFWSGTCELHKLILTTETTTHNSQDLKDVLLTSCWLIPQVSIWHPVKSITWQLRDYQSVQLRPAQYQAGGLTLVADCCILKHTSLTCTLSTPIANSTQARASLFFEMSVHTLHIAPNWKTHNKTAAFLPLLSLCTLR